MKIDGSDQNAKAQQAGNGQPMNDGERARKTLQSQINGMAKEFERALPGKIGVERMMRIVMTAILKTPALAICDPTTFFGALLQSLQLGLEVNTPLGQAYLIPRKKNDKNGRFLYWECNFQLGYQGLLELCYRSKQYEIITARIVYEGDDFDHRYGTNQHLYHVPRYVTDKPVYAYGYYKLREGGEDFVVWEYGKALKNGDEFSDAFDSKYAPWKKNAETQEAMIKKTMLKQVLHYAPKSVELSEASTADEHVIIADKYDENGQTQLRFDVKQLEAPNQEERDFMEQVNRAGKPEAEKEPVPATATPTKQAQQTAGNMQSGAPAAGENLQQTGLAAGGTPQTAGKSGLFSTDEEEALDDVFERSGVDGPDFTQ
jgi:recombination protein RecT